MNLSEELRRQQTEMKLGSVTSLRDDGTAIIRFDEDTAASGKNYSYLNSYIPKQGDRVLLAPMGNTYIILGAILFEESPHGGGGGVSEDKVREIAGELDVQVLSDVAASYLTQANASSTYLTKSSASSTYLTQTNASSTYLTKTDASSNYAAKNHSHTEYAPTDHIHDRITYKSSSSTHYVMLNSAVALVPSANGTVSLGSTTAKYKDLYVNNATIGSAATSSVVDIGGGAIKTGGNSSRAVGFFNTTPVVKQTVNKVSTSATLSTTITQLNALLTALAKYGLITSS